MSTPAPESRTLSTALRHRHVSMISLGGIIGAGLFVGSSASIAAVGPAVILSYLAAGLIILVVMQMLGEMALALPGVSSLTEFCRVGLGNWAGYTSGWLYWYFWVMVVGFEAVAGAKILQDWVALPVWQLAAMLLALLTLVNWMSARSFGEFEFWFSSIKVTAIVIFILVVAGFIGLRWSRGTDIFSNLTTHGGFAPHGALTVVSGVTSVLFALCGAEIVTIAAAETADPARAVARLARSVILRILLFYVLAILCVLMVVPWTDVEVGRSPFALALSRVGIPGAALTMRVIVLTAILSCLNSGLYVTSRVLHTLARHRDASAWFLGLSGGRVPTRAILVSSAVALVAVVMAYLSPEHVFAFMLNASGALMLIIYLLTALAQIQIRNRLTAAQRDGLRVRVWLYPWLSYAIVLSILAVLASMGFIADLAPQLWASLLLTAVVIAVYGWRSRRSGPSSRAALAQSAPRD